nr:winged helix-turn-helix domain-containing protein [Candidatus Sigynarchaeum springense]
MQATKVEKHHPEESEEMVGKEVPSNNIDYEKMARDLDVMGNATRLRILMLLLNSPRPVTFNDLASRLGIDRNALAYHVAILKSCELVSNTLQKGTGREFSRYSITEKARQYLERLVIRG